MLAEPHLVKNWLLRQEVPDEAEQNMLSICWLFQLGFQKLLTKDGIGVRFFMHPRISMRGSVRPSVGPSVGLWVRNAFSFTAEKGVS